MSNNFVAQLSIDFYLLPFKTCFCLFLYKCTDIPHFSSTKHTYTYIHFQIFHITTNFLVNVDSNNDILKIGCNYSFRGSIR